jgi:AcrR family transcriptional regulator
MVATEAGVALKTVYLAFETKSGLLRALWHRLLRGVREHVPVGGQSWFTEVMEEPDAERQLRLNARNSRMVKVRAGALMEVIRGAAPTDPEIAGLWHRIQTEFHENQRSVIESLNAKHALKSGLDVAAATDILWAINHPSMYQLLVGDRGWTPERYETWLADLLCRELLEL